jgi:hypothetical protein
MHSRALLTAILFGSAIASTRLLAQLPRAEPQNPGGQDQAGGPSISVAAPPRRAG